MRLLMHDLNMAGPASPFEAALDEVLVDGEADLACPFIRLSLLVPKLDRLNTWRLLTDIDAWLTITLKRPDRTSVRAWWMRHRSQVRNLPGLHAKVAVGRRAAMLGSANFTSKGFFGRVEAGVFLDDPQDVGCLRRWFDDAWLRGVELDGAALDGALSVPPPPIRSAGVDQSFPRPVSVGTNPLRGRRSTGRTPDPEAATDEQRLIRRLSGAPSQEWCDHFLDWVAALLRLVDLPHNDKRLKGSVTRAGQLNVSLNNRYSLATGHHRDGRVWLMIRRDDVYRIKELVPTATDDPNFFDHGRSPRTLVQVPFPLSAGVADAVRSLWEGALVDETHARTQTGGRRADAPCLFKAAVDSSYRATLLAMAFASDGQEGRRA